MEHFLDQLFQAAKAAGIKACEAYIVERDSFSAMIADGEVTEYKSNQTHGLGFRGIKNGRMGYSATEAFDEASVMQLVNGVCESAELCEDEDMEFLYDGTGEVPQLKLCSDEEDGIPVSQKIELAKQLEKSMKAYDSRIVKTNRNSIRTGRYRVRIVNSYGMDRSFVEDSYVMFGMAMAKEKDSVSTGFYGVAGRTPDILQPEKIGSETAKRAVSMLGARQVPSGQYRVVFENEAMADLLQTFCGIFSAENSQKGLSLLRERQGEAVASAVVTIIDDPLLTEGLDCRPFDAEGVPSAAHTVIENGVFKTFLHNLKTAYKDGVETTGNASKAGYASAVHVAPSNLYIKPAQKTVDELLGIAENGILITEVSGLHAGANPVSGDFSLLSKGFAFKDGKIVHAVEQITVAGNFYDLLRNIREVANDLVFPLGGIGSPSIFVGEMAISGR